MPRLYFRGNIFELQLASYCLSDVLILMSALIEFQTEFFEVSKRSEDYGPGKNRPKHDGIDVLKESLTIASACLKHYRLNHLNAGQLALVPNKGYDTAENQSRKAHKFLKWYAEMEQVNVQTAYSANGEKK